jgi:ubiquinone/menaquinone biosynthesis C-methylase UbiE
MLDKDVSINSMADLEDISCDPMTKDHLQYVNDEKTGACYKNVNTGRRFPIHDDVVDFLSDVQLTGQNLKYQRMYNRFALLYNFVTQLFARLRSGSERQRLTEYLKELETKPKDRVLETSIGTGRNLKYLPSDAAYFGVDISAGMLKRCRKLARRRHLNVRLFLAEAEHLPFLDEAFDTVYQVGGINFFNDKASALNEMVRVAKSGSKLLVVDETEKVAKKYENSALAGKFYNEHSGVIGAPVELLPNGVKEVSVKEVCGSDLYCLTFRKQ